MVKKITVVFGTRPEIIKLAELIKILKKKKRIKTTLIFTGQHYDYNLYQIFMKELQLPKIDLNLGIHKEGDSDQVLAMVKKLVNQFSKKMPDIVVAQGDTNSVLAAALASLYSEIRFAHVEAGLRSHDWRMPEERNRVFADALSSYAFAPTKESAVNLKKDKVRGKIYLTGNTIVEAVQTNLKKAKQSKILDKLGLEKENYAVLTAHRQEYVDKKKNLQVLLSAIKDINTEIIFSIHPRTVKNLKKFKLWKKLNSIKNLRLIKPIGYFDFLQLTSNSMFLLSDSGGIQEEVSIYKKFVIVLRDFTERPEIIGKFGKLIGYDKKKIVKESNWIIKNHKTLEKRLKKLKCPFGDGKASKKIAKILAGE